MSTKPPEPRRGFPSRSRAAFHALLSDLFRLFGDLLHTAVRGASLLRSPAVVFEVLEVRRSTRAQAGRAAASSSQAARPDVRSEYGRELPRVLPELTHVHAEITRPSASPFAAWCAAIAASVAIDETWPASFCSRNFVTSPPRQPASSNRQRGARQRSSAHVRTVSRPPAAETGLRANAVETDRFSERARSRLGRHADHADARDPRRRRPGVATRISRLGAALLWALIT